MVPRQSGRELVRAIAARARDPLQEIIDTVVPLSLLTSSPREAAELLGQVESEMTQHGWDPAATAIPVLRRRAMEAHSVERSMLLDRCARGRQPRPQSLTPHSSTRHTEVRKP